MEDESFEQTRCRGSDRSDELQTFLLSLPLRSLEDFLRVLRSPLFSSRGRACKKKPGSSVVLIWSKGSASHDWMFQTKGLARENGTINRRVPFASQPSARLASFLVPSTLFYRAQDLIKVLLEIPTHLRLEHPLSFTLTPSASSPLPSSSPPPRDLPHLHAPSLFVSQDALPLSGRRSFVFSLRLC